MWLSGCQADVKKWPNIFCKTIEFTTSYCHFLRIYSELIKNMIELAIFLSFLQVGSGQMDHKNKSEGTKVPPLHRPIQTNTLNKGRKAEW